MVLFLCCMVRGYANLEEARNKERRWNHDQGDKEGFAGRRMRTEKNKSKMTHKTNIRRYNKGPTWAETVSAAPCFRVCGILRSRVTVNQPVQPPKQCNFTRRLPLPPASHHPRARARDRCHLFQNSRACNEALCFVLSHMFHAPTYTPIRSHASTPVIAQAAYNAASVLEHLLTTSSFQISSCRPSTPSKPPGTARSHRIAPIQHKTTIKSNEFQGKSLYAKGMLVRIIILSPV